MFGFKKKTPVEEPATQAPQSKPKPTTPIQPEALGTGFAAKAGKALKNRAAQIDEAVGYADGGMIRGKGTGTSDSIKKEVEEGSYIMPADSTETLGEEALAGMGKSVPVNLSNGEYQLPPEQVHAVGVQALNQMKDATHTPVPDQGSATEGLGFKSADQKPELFLANGGNVSFYVDPEGNASRNLPSQSRELIPMSQSRELAVTSQPTAQARTPNTLPATTAQPMQRAQPAPSAQGFTPDQVNDARARATANVRADTAAFQAQRAAQDARFSQAAGGGAPAAPTAGRGFAAGARNVVNGGLGKVGGVLAALPAVANAAEDDSTARYAKRFGVAEPTGDGSVGDIAKFTALRAGGFASDLGNAMTMGLAGRLYNDEPGATKPAVLPQAQANSPSATPAAAPVQSVAQPDEVAPQAQGDNNVTRVGNSYSGNNIREGFTINGQPQSDGGYMVTPAVSTPGASVPQAAQQPAGFVPSGGLTVIQDGSAAETAKRNLMLKLNDKNLTASQRNQILSLHESGDRNDLTAATTAQNNATRLAEAGLQSDSAFQRSAMQEEGENRRANATNNIEQQKVDGEIEARGFQSRALARQEKLYQKYESAKPEERAAIAQQIRDLSGKADPQQNLRENFMTRKAPVTDAKGNVVGERDEIVDLRTGQPIGQQTNSAPKAGEQRGGYRFKGGNPADQKNWERI